MTMMYVSLVVRVLLVLVLVLQLRHSLTDATVIETLVVVVLYEALVSLIKLSLAFRGHRVGECSSDLAASTLPMLHTLFLVSAKLITTAHGTTSFSKVHLVAAFWQSIVVGCVSIEGHSVIMV